MRVYCRQGHSMVGNFSAIAYCIKSIFRCGPIQVHVVKGIGVHITAEEEFLDISHSWGRARFTGDQVHLRYGTPPPPITCLKWCMPLVKSPFPRMKTEWKPRVSS
jgi:hypothetical protein